MKDCFLILILCLGSLTAMFSQEVVFKQELSYDSVYMGNVLQIKYSIQNTNGDFQAPDFEGFAIVSGPNVSSQFSMINGAVTQSASYVYFLQPRSPGVYTLAPAVLENGDNLWSTEPIVITVLDNPDGIRQNPQGFQVINKFIQSDTTTMTMEDSLRMKFKKLKTRRI
jgi:hypothetical protein